MDEDPRWDEGDGLFAEFTDLAVSLTGVPDDPNRNSGSSKSAGAVIIADFTDVAQPPDDIGPQDFAPNET